jgi:hypothetical protein
MRSIDTPPLLGAGMELDEPFHASVPGTGAVDGTIQLRNEADTSGVIRVTDLQFQSFRPAGGGSVLFTVAVDQAFAYAGPPRVDGTFGLSGSTLFTASPQSSSGFIAGVMGFVFDPLPFSFAATAQDPFPQKKDFGFVSDLPMLPAMSPMNLRLNLSLSLSDNALSTGPRFDSPGGTGEFARIGYGPAVPEPSGLALLGLGVLGLIGYAWLPACRQYEA